MLPAAVNGLTAVGAGARYGAARIYRGVAPQVGALPRHGKAKVSAAVKLCGVVYLDL
jgi:hypothetical protein